MRTGGQEEKLVELGERIIGAALKVHSNLGPGMLESVYEICLAHELRKRGFAVEQQKPVSVVYDGLVLDSAYRLDLLVESQVVIEVKAVAGILPVHKAQLISYLKLGDFPLGYLMNFNEVHMKHGIKRLVKEI